MSFRSFTRRLAECVGLLLAGVCCWSNEVPSISRIANQRTYECTAIVVPFTVSDPESAPDQLIVSASSSNTNVLSEDNISIGASGANRTITLLMRGYLPVIVTVKVSDGESETATSFDVAAELCAGPPVIVPIPDFVMRENGTIEIPLTSSFCDRCNSTSEISWFVSSDNSILFPSSSVAVTSNDTNAILTLTPTANHTGQARLSVVVSDGSSSASQAFEVTVMPVGTWTDHFGGATLEEAWTGMRSEFFVTNGVLEGESALPVAPSPLNFVEVAVDSSDCDVSSWINIVAPNTRVCTKGALLLRHSGTNGYVFALHEPTQTVELYSLATHEMLFKKSARIEFGKWYHLRTQLRGATIALYVNDQRVGTVTNALYLNGSVGLAVQDAETAWFDDFVVTGANIKGNVDTIERPELRVEAASSNITVLRFLASPPFNYSLQASSEIFSHDWQTIAMFPAKLREFEAEFSEPATNAVRFYRIEKIPCNCD